LNFSSSLRHSEDAGNYGDCVGDLPRGVALITGVAQIAFAAVIGFSLALLLTLCRGGREASGGLIRLRLST
jgi:hypothetical protein